MSFSESMDVCLRTSLPFIFIALTFFAVSLSKASQGSWTRGWLSFLTGTSQKSVDFNVNDLMLGTQDPFLWFLVPLFGVISVGICIAGNYFITILMHVFMVGREVWLVGRTTIGMQKQIPASIVICPILLTNTAAGRLSPPPVDANVSLLPPFFSSSSQLSSHTNSLTWFSRLCSYVPAYEPSASPATHAPAHTTTSTTTQPRCWFLCSGSFQSTCQCLSSGFTISLSTG
jgi:hypothetical protein